MVSVATVMQPAPFLGGQTVSSFGVPPDGNSVGWWVDGPLVGSPAMAVMLGHTLVGNGYAVFNRLGELRPGDAVTVVGDAGAGHVDFRIVDVVAGIPKGDPVALQGALSSHSSRAQLALITCGGEFDRTSRSSADNIVAFAAIV